jgi:hypothetical protein
MSVEITSIIQNAFKEGQTPQFLMHCHLVLTPKVEHPTKLRDFRPLSVCSVYYRLLSKLITKIIKSVLSSLILYTQITYLRGQSIHDSIFLMKEVLQSFHV